MHRRMIIVVFAVVAAACGGGSAQPTADTSPNATAATAEDRPPATYILNEAEPAVVEEGELLHLDLELLTTGLSTPVAAVSPAGDGRIFVVEQTGQIRILLGDDLLETPYLDLTGEIEDEGLEQGLLAMAFHPDFATNGRVFVSFTNTDGDSRVYEYLQSLDDPNTLDVNTARTVIEVDQPHEYHNSGSMGFGPDGYLWVGFGDGGSVGDPYENGQNADTILGGVARIDINGDRPYTIPADNPFANGDGGAPELFVYGARNPWGITFTDDAMVFADVGHDFWEEGQRGTAR